MTSFTTRVRLLSRVAALAAIVMGAVACSGGSSSSSSLPVINGLATTSTAAATEPTAAAVTIASTPAATIDANGALQAGLTALAAGYHFSSTVTVNGTPSLTADGDRIGESSSLILTGDGGTVSYIVTPDGSYAKPEGGDWSLLDIAPATSDPIAALLAPVSVATVPTADGSVVVQATVAAVSLGISAEGTVDVQVLLVDGAITQITFTSPVDGGTAEVVTTISAVVDPTPIVAPI